MIAVVDEVAIAAVVTETTWTNAKGVEQTYRVGHPDPKCKRIKRGKIVDHDVRIDEAAAGMPCAWCWTPPAESESTEVPTLPGSSVGSLSAGDKNVAPPESGTTRGPTLPRPSVAPPSGGQRGIHAPEDSSPRVDAPSGPVERTSEAPPPGDDSTVPSARPTSPLPYGKRPNRYAGRCDLCGSDVQEQAGYFVGGKPGAWRVRHRDGDCQADAGAATNAAAAKRLGFPDVPAGHYAIDTPLGLVFLRVDRPTEGQYAGGTYIKEIVGGRPTGKRIARERAVALLILIEEVGLTVAAVRYGREIGRCCVCNRVLTDPDSRTLGIGPECRSKR